MSLVLKERRDIKVLRAWRVCPGQREIRVMAAFRDPEGLKEIA